MCNAHNHPPGCTCGWGGEGHLGVSGGYGALWHHGLLGDPHQHPGLLRQLAVRHRTSFAIPTACWYCGQDIYIYANEYGSVVLFDELGWPWPKHDCPNAPPHLRGESLRRPNQFLTRMPTEQARWFKTVLSDLEAQGRDSEYAKHSRVPAAVLSGEYDRERPTLDFLRDLAHGNALRWGVFLPLDCASCQYPVWLFVPASGDLFFVEEREDGAVRHHRCLTGGSSKMGAIRRSLPHVVSWRHVETRLRASPDHAVPVREGQIVIGHVADQAGPHLIVRPWKQGQPVEVPSTVKHPVYTLIVGMPDPYNPGQYVVRAPTIEQFMRGLPGSLPAIVREADLPTTTLPQAAPPAAAPEPPKQPVKRQPAKDTPPQGASYPREFERPEVLAFFRAVTLETLPLEDQERWRTLEAQSGWHLGGRVPPRHAKTFIACLHQAERFPQLRARCREEMTGIGRRIALHVRGQLRGKRPKIRS